MTRDELLEELSTLEQPGRKRRNGYPISDSEGVHLEADSLLLEYINDVEITEAFNKLKRWYA